MNYASRIIEALRERASQQLGGRRSMHAAKQRPFERGNGRDVQTAIIPLGLGFYPHPLLTRLPTPPELHRLSGTLCSLAVLAVGG